MRTIEENLKVKELIENKNIFGAMHYCYELNLLAKHLYNSFREVMTTTSDVALSTALYKKSSYYTGLEDKLSNFIKDQKKELNKDVLEIVNSYEKAWITTINDNSIKNEQINTKGKEI